MEAIHLDSSGRPRTRGPYRAPATRWNGTAHRLRSDLDPAMIFAASVLLAASVIRLVPPCFGSEAFGVEPTLALGATLACAWLMVREVGCRVLDYRAALRARALGRSRLRRREARST